MRAGRPRPYPQRRHGWHGIVIVIIERRGAVIAPAMIVMTAMYDINEIPPSAD